MHTRSRLLPIATAVLAAALLTGCTSTAESAASDPGTSSPTASPSSSPSDTAEAPANDLFGVAPGELLAEAVARTGATPVEGCAWAATAEKEGYRLQIQAPEGQTDPDAAVALVALTAPVGSAAQGPIGPRTAEGIGIGSTLDEARTAYPDVREVPAAEGPQRYLEVTTGDRPEPLFLAYSDGTPVIWGVVATDVETPALAPCA